MREARAVRRIAIPGRVSIKGAQIASIMAQNYDLAEEKDPQGMQALRHAVKVPKASMLRSVRNVRKQGVLKLGLSLAKVR